MTFAPQAWPSPQRVATGNVILLARIISAARPDGGSAAPSAEDLALERRWQLEWDRRNIED
jgi:hypothetical protein